MADEPQLEPSTVPSDASQQQQELLRSYELLLVHRCRFALADVIVCVHAIVQELQVLERTLAAAMPSNANSNKKLAAVQDTMERIGYRVRCVAELTPTFLGDGEIVAFLDALREFGRLPELAEAYKHQVPDGAAEAVTTLLQSISTLEMHTEDLAEAATHAASVCVLLTKKRNHLARFMDEAVQVLQNSHSRRLRQYEDAVVQLSKSYKDALQDSCLQRARQLRFDIQAIETSMSTMLLPHFEICRTIATANAQVQPSGTLFSELDCEQISTFVRTTAKLKNGEVEFRSVLRDPTVFLTQLQLFEKAASKDAFLVCSTALKLQFRESLDDELFHAYVNDWRAKTTALKRMETSADYRAVMKQLQDLKVAIGKAHEGTQTSKEKMIKDDPTREALVEEIARIFHDEGGTVSCTNLFAYAV